MSPADLRSKLETLHAGSYAWAIACCGGCREEAADVLQAAYEKVLSGKAKFGGRSALKTWLFGVIRRTAQEAVRREYQRTVVYKNFADQPTDGNDTSVDVEQIGLALKQLSPQQLQVVHLVFYEGMTIQEAADALEISVGSARQHYARAKEKLRSQLQSELAAS
ncbi:MAG: sigma-70 family RNA polymerase sigma factor [Verrucomicrobiota bacterium]